jgi:hypothetical protein
MEHAWQRAAKARRLLNLRWGHPVEKEAVLAIFASARRDAPVREPVRAFGAYLPPLQASSVWSMSSMCSRPIDSRIISGEMPTRARASSSSWRCVVIASQIALGELVIRMVCEPSYRTHPTRRS